LDSIRDDEFHLDAALFESAILGPVDSGAHDRRCNPVLARPNP
jgi:hypothetical protein